MEKNNATCVFQYIETALVVINGHRKNITRFLQNFFSTFRIRGWNTLTQHLTPRKDVRFNIIRLLKNYIIMPHILFIN